MLAGRCSEAYVNTQAYRYIVLLVVLWTVLTPLAAKSYDFQDCVGCHESLEAESKGERLHAPFMDAACASCHAAEIAEEFTASELKEQLRVIWLGEALAPFAGHVFLLPVRKVREFLVIDVKKSDGTFSRHEVLVPPLSKLPVEEDSGEAPVLSAVQVLQVKPGVFLSATVGWQADTITDALVRYGEQELSQVVGPVSRLGREHQVVLQNLRADWSYRFAVVSTDLFGRSRESEPVTFSTADFPIPATSVSPDLGLDPGNAGFVHRFKRHGSDYLLELTFDSPAQVLVGSRGKVRGEGLPADEFHEGLSGKPVMSMKACYSCHKPHLHPLDVAPAKPGVIIPADFPTLSGGRITCTSCHVPHSTQNDFYLRKPDKQELCASCHPKWVKLK